MFCSKCGKEIDDAAVVCVHCGCATPNMNKDNEKKSEPIIINNNNTAAASAVATNGRRHYSLLFDIIMLVCTGGLWAIWMILRPKY